jgi:hypothetical protein
VTAVGEAQKGVAWPDAANDTSVGVVGCIPGGDVDTAYSTGDMVPVYKVGSGAVVWVRYKTSAGALVAGTLIGNDGATAANGLGILGVEGTYENIGTVEHWHDDIGAEAWIKVRLGGR